MPPAGSPSIWGAGGRRVKRPAPTIGKACPVRGGRGHLGSDPVRAAIAATRWAASEPSGVRPRHVACGWGLCAAPAATGRDTAARCRFSLPAGHPRAHLAAIVVAEICTEESVSQPPGPTAAPTTHGVVGQEDVQVMGHDTHTPDLIVVVASLAGTQMFQLGSRHLIR